MAFYNRYFTLLLSLLFFGLTRAKLGEKRLTEAKLSCVKYRKSTGCAEPKLFVNVTDEGCARLCMKMHFQSRGNCLCASYGHDNSTCEICAEEGFRLEKNPNWDTWILKPLIRDCSELGSQSSGVYWIILENDVNGAAVYCDQETDGGGWTVFQRRLDGSEDFYRPWVDYKTGFGLPSGEYWMGNDNLHDITSRPGIYELRIDLEDFNGTSVYALYSTFKIADEEQQYKMTVTGYSSKSTAGNSFTHHSGLKFSTYDQDNDSSGSSCARSYKGAWWYGKCHSSNLNGRYHGGAHASYADGVNWKAYTGYHYSLKRSEMKIRPIKT